MELDRIELPVNLVEPGLREVIDYGDHGLLSREILRQWSVRSVWTAVPPGTDVERLLNLQAGGLGYSGRTTPTVIAFIRQYLQEADDRLALFEDAAANAQDLAQAGSKSPYAVVDGNTFPLLTSGDHDKSEVEDLILESYSWRLVGILTTWTVKPQGHVLGSSLEELVSRSQQVIVGAWDGEGLIVVDR